LALAIVVGLAVLVGGTAGAAAYSWNHAGNVRLAVHESGPDGMHMAISLPAVLVNTAIALCPVPADLRIDPRWEDMIPALRSAAESLSDMPDVVFVDVHDGDEHVRIAKSGRELVISVNTPDERFELALPIESLRRIAAKLEAKVAA